MLTVPDYRQAFDWDCGASAARSVAAHFGVGFGTAAEYIAALGTDPDGTWADRIADVLRGFCLCVVVIDDMTLDELRAQRTPVICAIQGGSHWVVVTGVDTDVYLQDPVCGRVKSTIDDFMRDWRDAGIGRNRLGIVVSESE